MKDDTPAPTRSAPQSYAQALTVENLLQAVAGDLALNEIRRRDLRSALRKLCKSLGRHPRDVVLTPEALREWSSSALNAQRLRVSAKTARNVCSDLRTVVEKYVRPGLQALRRVPLTERWERLRALGEGVQEIQYGLIRFMRYCSLHQIEPESLTDYHYSGYVDWLSAAATRKDPKRGAQLDRNVWNRAVRRIQGWPQIILKSAQERKTYVRPWAGFGPSLQADVAAWKACQSNADPFDDRCPSRPLRQTSIDHHDFLLRAAASAMVLEGIPSNALRSLADLVRPEHAQLVFAFMKRRLRREKSSQMAQIASLMRAIAKHWVGAGATTIVPLKRAQRLYAPDPFQVSSKNRTRVQQLKDPNNLFALVTLPQQIARQFEAMRAPKMRDVYDLEAALLIEIELMFPIRLRNLSRLVLGDQVRVIGRGTGRQIAICIPREEVKNSVDLLARLPPQSTSLYDLYMKLARPRITSAPSSFLFPSESGDTHRHQATLSRRVTRVIRKRTGMDLNVHCFRHVAAYTFLGEHIGAYEDLRRILGHTTIGTSVRYYADLETQTAVDRLHQSILNVRKYAAA